jgi:hypothetical protein
MCAAVALQHPAAADFDGASSSSFNGDAARATVAAAIDTAGRKDPRARYSE